MLYLLYGLEKFLINKEVEKILKNNNINEYSVSKFNGKQNSLDEIILDAISMSLFGEMRATIIEDAYYFTSEKAESEETTIRISNYLNDYNKNNITIFIVNSEKLDERKKVTKLAKKVATVLEFNAKSDSNDIIKDLLKKYDINYRNINLIKERLNNQNELIENEINKLMIYKDNQIITEDDINNVISKYPKIDFFEFIDNIINKNINESVKTYEELLKLKEEPIKIIVTLANQFRLMYQTKKMTESGYSEKDIALELGEHPYRIKLAAQKARNYSDNDLIIKLKTLGKINLDSKKGIIDSKIALELFILGMWEGK